MNTRKENHENSPLRVRGSNGPSRKDGSKGLQCSAENTRANLTKEAIAGATVLAANASGFATFQGTSVALSAASSMAGVTLPFSAYAGTSVAIGWATGPAALAAIGACALWKLF